MALNAKREGNEHKRNMENGFVLVWFQVLAYIRERMNHRYEILFKWFRSQRYNRQHEIYTLDALHTWFKLKGKLTQK